MQSKISPELQRRLISEMEEVMRNSIAMGNILPMFESCDISNWKIAVSLALSQTSCSHKEIFLLAYKRMIETYANLERVYNKETMYLSQVRALDNSNWIAMVDYFSLMRTFIFAQKGLTVIHFTRQCKPKIGAKNRGIGELIKRINKVNLNRFINETNP